MVAKIQRQAVDLTPKTKAGLRLLDVPFRLRRRFLGVPVFIEEELVFFVFSIYQLSVSYVLFWGAKRKKELLGSLFQKKLFKILLHKD